MKSIAILITCHNRKDKTVSCLDSIQRTISPCEERISPKVFLVDDGCTDGTADAVRGAGYSFPVHIIEGDGNLFWNGGMILAWKEALRTGGFDGYLWINDDITMLPEFWPDLLTTDDYCRRNYGRGGIYVGSTKDSQTGRLTYGGFFYNNKWTLEDRFVIPDGEHIQPCEAAHGNITYVAHDVVESRGILDSRYWHGGSDHDYTYLANKAGIPVLVLPRYSALCKNDHLGKTRLHAALPLRERLKVFWSPKGFNMHNALLFNWRCFPYRAPFVLLIGITKCIFPSFGYKLYDIQRHA